MPLIYVKHEGCSSKRILTLDVNVHRVRCPTCNAFYQAAEPWKTDDFYCPFVKQIKTECCIILKPTQGFFAAYQIGNALHVGISDSQTRVHSFTANGIVVEDATNWDKSIIVCAFDNNDRRDPDWFDRELKEYLDANAQRYTAQYYNAVSHNCFDFAKDFYVWASGNEVTKAIFTKEHVVMPLNYARGYGRLVDKVQRNGGFMLVDDLFPGRIPILDGRESST